MTLAVDDIWVREPGLLLPGKQPLGLVKPDFSHPQVATANWAFCFGGFNHTGNTRRWFGNNSCGRADNGTYTGTPTIYSGLRGNKSTDWILRETGTNDVLWIQTSSPGNSGDFSTLQIVAEPAQAVNSYVWSSRDASSPYYVSTFRLNSYYSEGSATGTNSPGTVYFGVTGAGGATGVRVDDVLTGAPQCFVAVRRSDIYEIWLNGVLIGSEDRSDNPRPILYSDVFAIGGWGAVTGVGINGSLDLIVEWEYALTPAQAQSLSADPWQMVVPA